MERHKWSLSVIRDFYEVCEGGGGGEGVLSFLPKKRFFLSQPEETKIKV